MIGDIMGEATEELIPLSILHDILFDESVFKNFLERKDIFKDIDLDKTIINLNDYMRLIIKTSNELNPDVYRRINIINANYGNKNSFNANLEGTDKLVPIEAIESILKDQLVFDRFMNFDNNKDEFNMGTLLAYLIEIVDYYNYIKEKEIVIDYEVIKRYKTIMKKYSLELKRFQSLEGSYAKGIINEAMEEDIFSSIDFNRNLFSTCYQLYWALNKRCKYSTSYIVMKDIQNEDLAMEIYNEDIENIDKDNNEVTCNTWANMYAYLLKRIGVDARVVGDYHKYVEFDCDGTLMRADATDAKLVGSDGFYLNDITRCQLGLQVENFICLETEKDISDILYEEYRAVVGNNTLDALKLKALENQYKEEYLSLENKTPFSLKIKLIKEKYLECGLKGAELAKYLDLLMKLSFSNDELINMEVRYVALRKQNNIYDMSVIFRVDDNYYIFDDKVGLIVKETSEIIRMHNNKDLVLIGHNSRLNELNRSDDRTYGRVG